MAYDSMNLVSSRTARYNYNGGAASTSKSGDVTITVKMKGTTPAAHADAILKHFKMSKADEQAFKEKYGYDLRQFLTDSYARNDDPKSHNDIGGGKYQVVIPIRGELIAQIKAVKSRAQAPTPVPTAAPNPNQVIAERNSYDRSVQTRNQLEGNLPPTAQPTTSATPPQPHPSPAPTPAATANVGSRDVSQMGMTERLQIVFTKALAHLGPEAAEKFKQLLTPENIAIMVVTTGALIAVQGVPVLDVIVDAAILGFAAYTLGSEAIDVMGDLVNFATKTAGATSETDLDEAAQSLAKATATVGVDALAAILIHKGVKSIKGTTPPPNTRVIEMVTPEGVRVRVRIPIEEPVDGKGSNVLESRSRVAENDRRNVQTQEQSGGHTIARHVGKSERWLRNRLETDPNLKTSEYASSFRNEQIANRAQGRFVNRFKNEIDDWLKSENPQNLVREFDMGEPVGIVVERGRSGYTATSKVTVVLAKDSSSQGWHFLTSYASK